MRSIEVQLVRVSFPPRSRSIELSPVYPYSSTLDFLWQFGRVDVKSVIAELHAKRLHQDSDHSVERATPRKRDGRLACEDMRSLLGALPTMVSSD